MRLTKSRGRRPVIEQTAPSVPMHGIPSLERDRTAEQTSRFHRGCVRKNETGQDHNRTMTNPRRTSLRQHPKWVLRSSKAQTHYGKQAKRESKKLWQTF